MDRALVAMLLVALAVVAAVLIERRRRPDAPTQDRWPVPTQLDRADFAQPDAAWLVAVFTSATCDACAKAVSAATPLASDEVAVDEVPVASRGDVHRRYGITAVPLLVVADHEGVVRASFLGAPRATELWTAVARVRDLGEEAAGGSG